MSNYQAVLFLVEELGVKCWTTQVYIKITGSLELGVFLERIVWWSDKTSRTDGFFWKKAEEWGEELCVSYDQVNRMTKKLESLGFIETSLKRANNAPTTHYRPVMPVILNSITPIFEKVEIRESRNSGNSNLDFRESLKSDIRESRNSITGKTHEPQQEGETPQKDYLETIVEGIGNVSEVTASNPEDQWLEYRDKALKAFPGDWGRTVGEKEIKRNLILGFVANNPNFNPDHWAFVIQDSIAHGVSSNNIARFIEVYPFKNYEDYLASKYPKAENGRDSPEPPKPKYVTIPVTNQESSDNG